MLFKSSRPDIHIPDDISVWNWLFENPTTSPLHRFPAHDQGAFTNAATKERIDWTQVKQASTYVSTALVKKYGLRETETVALFTQNTVWYPVAMFAAIRAGGKVAGASPAYNVEEMSYALKTAEAKYLMAGPSSLKVAISAAKNAGIPRQHVFLLDGEERGFTTFKDLINIGKSYGEQDQIAEWSIPRGKTNKEICGFLNFSSGTTGLPKAVMLSHHNVMAQCYQMKDSSPPGKKIYLGVLPLYHITGLIRFCTNPVFLNDDVILLPQFTLPATLSAISTHKITELILVPPLIIRFANDPSILEADLSSVKRISCGAAPLSPEVTMKLQARFPKAGFRQGYGMTESCGCLTTHLPEYYGYEYAHTVGNIVASTELKIIDPDSGVELGYGQPGEIWARGPQIAMGYLGNTKSTAEAFDKDGFFHTGDIGAVGEDGLICIVDRIKEMIKVKGIAVAPAELEDLLLSHDLVADCAVLGIKDAYSGERPKAFVVKKNGVEEGRLGRELLALVREKKVRFKWLVEIEFLEQIPRSPSGKILRRVLKQREKDGVKGVIVRDDEREGVRARL